MGTKKTLQQSVQSFGRSLSAMIMPNIGAFIAWGIVTALFIPKGYFPNENIEKLVGPTIKYLLPLLIGYTGGKNIYGVRGGVMGAIATMGVIVGVEIPMFIGAMIMGPVGGILIKKFDEKFQDKIPSGFEMLVNNFSIGILGGALSILALLVIGPVVAGLTNTLGTGVAALATKGFLPILSVLIEPAKVLFLNNAINHGVLTPLGTQQVLETGRSIYYLLEANPGPGLGVLLAYCVFAKGSVKSSAPGAAIIHFFGGIHEIYFPYVLMNPALILAVIGGGAAGVFTFTIFGAGLTAPASPGSIIAILGMTSRGGYFGVIAGVVVATVVSFLIASIFVKKSASKQDEGDFEKAKEKMKEMKINKKGAPSTINTIVYACDAGMGSSAMGASILGKKLAKQGYTISVKNYAIENIPKDASIVVSHEQLTKRAKSVAPNAYHISVKDFLDSSISEEIIGLIDQNQKAVLEEKNVIVGAYSSSKEEAILKAGDLLVESGYVLQGYQQAMLEREESVSTYIGCGVAIPHCVASGKQLIVRSGVVVLLYPEGVHFGDEKAYIVLGIAGVGEEHLDIISKLADIIDAYTLEDIIELAKSKESSKIYNLLK